MNPLALIMALGFLGLYDSPRRLDGTNPSKGHLVIRAFNSFQLVASFAGLPFLIGWLGSAPFAYSQAAFWAAIVAYVVLFAILTFLVFDSLDGK